MRFFTIICFAAFCLFKDGKQVFGQTGPAGVGNSSNNILWLRSDAINGLIDGDTITTWVDTSGNNNDVSQPVIALKPEYVTNSVNGFPVVSFNAANSRLRRNPFNGFASNEITGIYVNKNSESNDGIISYASGGSNNDFLFYASQNIGFYRGPNVNTGISTNDNNWHIIQGGWNSVGGNVEMWKDGSKDYVGISFRSNTSITDGGSLCIAHEQDSPDGSYASNQDHTGDFTEVIIYNIALDRTDHIIIANYLSAKYDIALADHDIYLQDNPANGDYDYEVAGIGQFAAGVLNDDAQGSSFVRILNPSGLDNGEYLIWGHDGTSATASNMVDVPGSVQARYDRVWRVNEVNVFGTAVDVGSIDMRWDLSTSGPVTASDLRLLVDTDNDGVFIDETPISGATDLGGDIYEFAGVTAIANNVRFTLATINVLATPLPISLVSFSGYELDEQSNLLRWKTASETNNKLFTMRRSADAVNWFEVEQIDGAGNSSKEIDYQLIDKGYTSDLTYYQLSQTDFDGKEVVVQTISVKRKKRNTYQIYPNPTEGLIIISGLDIVNTSIMVYNSTGKQVEAEKAVLNNNINLDLSSFPSGLYCIKIGAEIVKVIVK